MIESVLFYFLAAVLVGTALLVVTRTNPIGSAIALVVGFGSLSGLYAMLSASLVAILQVLVYAGGIMVLVIFVIMLLNLRKEELEPMRARAGSLVGFLGFSLVFFVVPVWMVLPFIWKPHLAVLEPGFGSITAVGTKLFAEYTFPFEMLSLVLLTAVVGALVLSKRKL